MLRFPAIFSMLFSAIVFAFLPAVSQSQPVSHAQQNDETCAIDLMLVLDGSGSIAPEDFDRMKDFVNALIEELGTVSTDAQIGVVQFSTSSELFTSLSSNFGEVDTIVQDMPQLDGDTNIVDGILSAQIELERGRVDAPDFVILMTDGEHTEAGDPIYTAGQARAADITLFGLAVGNANLDEISAIAGSEQNLFVVGGYEGLSVAIRQMLINTVCDIQPGPSQIAFASDRDGDFEIYVMNPDGSDLRQITDNNAEDNAPSWSPDGTQIAFESDLDGDFEIYVMNADGSDLRQITDNETPDYGPAWSPNGDLLAFHATPNIATDLFVINVDGTNLRQLTDTGGLDRSISWSPDGQRIVFQSDESGGREVHVMNVFTGHTVRLTGNQWYDGLPDWSPTGAQIVFGSTRTNGDVEIFIMRADGSNVQQLTNRRGIDDDPVWSPDGRQIIFESDASGNHELWIMNADGTNLRNITNHPGWDWSSDWSWKP